MFKLIGMLTVVWAMFHFGIAQFFAVWAAIVFATVASI